MSHFHKQGNIFTVVPEEAMDIRSKLPAAVYVVGASPMGFYLEHTHDFDVKFKLYGDVTRNSERILNTYLDRPNSTGVLLAGEKGSGKTLLAKVLARDAVKTHDIPTLVVTKPFHGDGFNALMQNISQPCVVIFDEFEKVYDHEQQQAILTLLDGMVVTKKLFVLTVNDIFKVDSHMKNRPGRLFYRLDFDGLSEEFVRGYAEDNLEDKSHIDTLCKSLNLFDKFNFDMLKSLVEEMNRYKESAASAMRFLNIRPDVRKDMYIVTAYYKGKECKIGGRDHWHGNPLIESYEVALYPNQEERQQYVEELQAQKMDARDILKAVKKNFDEKDDNQVVVTISPEKISKMDARSGYFEYEFPEHKTRVTLTQKLVKEFDYYKYMD